MNTNTAWTKGLLATVLILAPLALSISISMDIYVPSLPAIMDSFHTSQQAVQWTLSIYMLGVGLGQLICGPLIDRFGRRRIVLIGLSLYSVGTAVCIYAHSIDTLVVGRLMQSLGSCTAIVVAYAVVRDVYDTQKGAKVYSFLNAIGATAPVLAPLLGGYLQIGFGSWRASFVFLFIFAIFSLIITFIFLPETLAKSNSRRIDIKLIINNYKTLLTSSSFMRHSYYTTVALTGLFVYCCVSSYILIKLLHVSLPVYGLMFGLNASFLVISNLLSARLTNTQGIKFTVRAGVILILLGAGILVTTNLALGLTLLHFVLPMILLTMGCGVTMGPAIAGGLADYAHMAGTASALINSMQFTIAGLAGTLLMIGTIKSALPFAALMLGMGLVALYLNLNKSPPAI
jgi:Bcr/CflA subfamily drug resistance transporter